jgi:hypothetical protein
MTQASLVGYFLVRLSDALICLYPEGGHDGSRIRQEADGVVRAYVPRDRRPLATFFRPLLAGKSASVATAPRRPGERAGKTSPRGPCGG